MMIYIVITLCLKVIMSNYAEQVITAQNFFFSPFFDGSLFDLTCYDYSAGKAASSQVHQKHSASLLLDCYKQASPLGSWSTAGWTLDLSVGSSLARAAKITVHTPQAQHK